MTEKKPGKELVETPRFRIERDAHGTTFRRKSPDGIETAWKALALVMIVGTPIAVAVASEAAAVLVTLLPGIFLVILNLSIAERRATGKWVTSPRKSLRFERSASTYRENERTTLVLDGEKLDDDESIDGVLVFRRKLKGGDAYPIVIVTSKRAITIEMVTKIEEAHAIATTLREALGEEPVERSFLPEPGLTGGMLFLTVALVAIELGAFVIAPLFGLAFQGRNHLPEAELLVRAVVVPSTLVLLDVLIGRVMSFSMRGAGPKSHASLREIAAKQRASS